MKPRCRICHQEVKLTRHGLAVVHMSKYTKRKCKGSSKRPIMTGGGNETSGES